MCNKFSFNKVVVCYLKAKFHENIVALQNCANPLAQGGGGGGWGIVIQTVCTSVTVQMLPNI